MKQEDIQKLIAEIEKDEYIDCSDSTDYSDDKRYERILSALKLNLSLQDKLETIEVENMNLMLRIESLEKRLKHLLKSNTISNYDTVKGSEYVKNINELDSYIKMCNEAAIKYLLANNKLDRMGDFKVLRLKNNIELVYDPIQKPIELQLKIVKNEDDITCPICGKELGNYPAISRADNKTLVCSNCGMLEAVAIFKEAMDNEEKI